MHRFGLAALLVLALATLATRPVAAGPIMAVDVGGEFMKIALVGGANPTRTAPITIVINEMSRRRSATAVAWGPTGQRLLGDEAAASVARRPAAAITALWSLLGRNATAGGGGAGAESAAAAAAAGPLTLVPTGARGALGVQLPPTAAAAAAKGSEKAAATTTTTTTITGEEAAACVLTYARRLAEAAASSPITEAVLAVPPSATPAARAALVDGAALAGLAVLGVISAPAAAALQYGIDRPWDAAARPGAPGGPATIAIVDVGSVHASAALVRYSAYPKKGAASGSVGQFEVLDVAWAGDGDGAGSAALDGVLAARAAAAFVAAGGPDPLADPRASARLLKAVRRTKEILSANGDAPVAVEDLTDGRDLRAVVSRSDFEADAAAAFAAAAAPLATVLARSKVAVDQLAAVELVGGGTRVPGVQAALRAVLGGRALDRHLDADEAVAMGAALFGANASTAVRLRPFGGGDVAGWGQTLATVAVDKAGRPVGKASAAAPLIPFARRLPARRVARFPVPADKGADGLELTVAYDPASPNGLPADAAATGGVVGVWRLSGLSGAAASLGKDAVAAKAVPRIELHFKTALDGRAAPDRAELVAEWEEKAPVEADKKAAAAAAKGKKDAAADANSTAATTPTPPPPPPAPKKRVARATLTLSPADPDAAWANPRLPPPERTAAAARLAAADAADAAAAAAAAAKNELEAYIIATRGRLEAAATDEPDLVATTTADERGALAAACTDAEDWLYDDGEGEGAAAFAARLAALRSVGDRLFARGPNRAALPGALEAAARTAAAAEAAVAAWTKKGGPDARPYLPAADVAALKAAAGALKAKAGGPAAKAALKAPPTADVSLPVEEVEAAAAAVEKARARLARVKPPPPPPPPPPETPKATPKAKADKKEKKKEKGEKEKKEGDKAAAATAADAPAPAPAPPPTPEAAADKAAEVEVEEGGGDAR